MKNLNQITTDSAVDENAAVSQEYYSIAYNQSENLIYYAYSDNREFANMSDCKIEMIDGKMKITNARII